jgi:translocator protein
MDWRLLAPLVIGWTMGRLFPVQADTRLNPPGWVFGLAWTVLYLLIGIGWSRNHDHDRDYLILLLILNSWLIIRQLTYNTTSGWMQLVPLIVGVLWSRRMALSQRQHILFLPLQIWLVFAAILNVRQLSKNHSPPQL